MIISNAPFNVSKTKSKEAPKKKEIPQEKHLHILPTTQSSIQNNNNPLDTLIDSINLGEFEMMWSEIDSHENRNHSAQGAGARSFNIS